MDNNEFFREAVLRISSSLDFGIALKRLLGLLKKFMPVEVVFATFYIQEEKVIRSFTHAMLIESLPLIRELALTPDMIAHVEDVFAAEAEISIVNDPDTDPIARGWMAFHPEIRNSSYLVVPMEIEKNSLGIMIFGVARRNAFNPTHAERIRLIQEPLALACSNALRYQGLLQLKDRLDEENKALSEEIRHLKGDAIIGSDLGLRGVMEMVAQVASLDSPVLLLGETGVGKEVIANAIHGASSRSAGPFIKVNCGAIPEGLMDSELFGHEKGAFTGAHSCKRGKFERAHGGTLFLDEIGELPPAAQVRLLRVLQQKEIERVGGSEMIPVDVRIISATHRNLEKRIQTGQFREDLWFRLNIFPITIPPLRHRRNDIPELVRYFLKKKSMDLKIHPVPQVQEGEVDRLCGWSWPGNVRELENIVERALIQSRSRGGLVIFDLPMGEALGTVVSDTPFPSLDMVAVRHIRKALEHSGGQIHGAGGAAELLGINPNTLRSRMRRLGIYQKGKAGG